MIMDLWCQILLSAAGLIFCAALVFLLIRQYRSMSRMREELRSLHRRNEANERNIRALQDIVTQLKDAAGADGAGDEDFLSKVTLWMECNMSDPDATVDGMAAFLGMRRTSMYNRVKSLTGRSPVELLSEYRMKKAASFLKGSRIPAISAGYSANVSVCHLWNISGSPDVYDPVFITNRSRCGSLSL